MDGVALDAPQAHDDLEGVAPPSATFHLVGHAEPWRALAEAERAGRLHHAWLLQGPQGIGKATAAYAFSRRLAAPDSETGTEGEPAFSPSHAIVRQIALGTYPGLIHITRPPAERGGGFRTQITVDEVRKLNRFFHSTASGSGWRIAIIDPADDMNRSAANALLKILEEPPPRSIFLIVSHMPGQLLPTIRSRCRVLRFSPLTEAEVQTVVAKALPAAASQEVELAARLAGGSVRQAISMIAHGGIEIRQTLSGLLEAERPDWNGIHALADALTGRGREAAYDLLVTSIVSEIAGESERRLGAGDSGGASAFAELWQSETARLREGAAYNLDRKQMLITLFQNIALCRERAVRGLAAHAAD